jgi:hypothetical protein
MQLLGHIAGVPVEETLGMLGPVVGALVAALGATLRRGLRQNRPAEDDRRRRRV